MMDRPTPASEVAGAFDRVARRYDLMCRLNPGYLGMLRDAAAALHPLPVPRLLDLCCGTGLSTAALRVAHPGVPIVALDASPAMLSQARRKRLPGVALVAGDGDEPGRYVTGPFGGILTCYGLRNLPDPGRALRGLHALLAPGGVLVVQEYTLSGRYAERLWRWMSRLVVRPLCGALSGAPELFAYLERSVLDFDRRDELARRLEQAGFVLRDVRPGRHWQRHLVHTFVAQRHG